MSRVLSTPDQRRRIAGIVKACLRLPMFASAVPGALVENVLAHVRNAKVLRTYDYIDVLHPGERVGWSVKSTQRASPLTWKRAKIPNKQELIRESQSKQGSAQPLGDAILAFCNAHARASLERYDLDEIGYARLLVEPSGLVRYSERLLCTRAQPVLFDPAGFEWRWSEPKATRAKEQLPALHGFRDGRKW